MTVANRSSFYDQISANKRNSFLLAAFVVVVLGVLGFTRREFFDAEPEADAVPAVDLSLK